MIEKLNNKFNLKISSFEKENENLKLKSSEWIKTSRKSFEKDLVEYEEKNGIKIPIEVVNAPPAQFQFNHLYIRADGKNAYLFTLKES